MPAHHTNVDNSVQNFIFFKKKNSYTLMASFWKKKSKRCLPAYRVWNMHYIWSDKCSAKVFNNQNGIASRGLESNRHSAERLKGETPIEPRN